MWLLLLGMLLVVLLRVGGLVWWWRGLRGHLVQWPAVLAYVMYTAPLSGWSRCWSLRSWGWGWWPWEGMGRCWKVTLGMCWVARCAGVVGLHSTGWACFTGAAWWASRACTSGPVSLGAM